MGDNDENVLNFISCVFTTIELEDKPEENESRTSPIGRLESYISNLEDNSPEGQLHVK